MYKWLFGPNLQISEMGCSYLPHRATLGAACWDLRAPHAVELPPHEVTKIPLGIKSSFRPGWVVRIHGRSGMESKGLIRVAGTIDSDYRGEWMVCILNTNHKAYLVRRGDKIAQMILQRCWRSRYKVVETLPPSRRGVGGFGSTGR